MSVAMHTGFRVSNSPCNQLQRDAHRFGHLRCKLAEEISRGREPELKRRPLPCVRGVVEAGRKVAVADKPSGRGAGEVRYGGHRVPGVRAIHKGEGQRVKTSRKCV